MERELEIKKLNDKELIMNTEELVKKEKMLTAQILKYLQEIERRKVYADFGHHSLFQYCVKGLKYSEAEASYRVNAMRLQKDSQVASKKIVSGELSLTSASKIQTFLKQENIRDVLVKDKIINEVAGKSVRQVERILESHKSDSTPQSKTIIINPRLLKKLEKLQDELGDYTEAELLEILVDQKLKDIAAARPTRKSRGSVQQRYIDRKTKEFINQRSQGQCEYKTNAGPRCRARRFLEFDHIKPVAIGGQSYRDNLRLVCRGHNQRFAFKSVSRFG